LGERETANGDREYERENGDQQANQLNADRETRGNAWEERRDHETFGSDRERSKRQIDERSIFDPGLCID
jgi:hypothetical protein